MICMTLNLVRLVLSIWRVERCVCFWPSTFSKPTISATIIVSVLCSARMLQSAGLMLSVSAACFANFC